jgi:capsular polysaccharide export protein
MRQRFLFLQGPIGPFFRELGLRLGAAGHAVHRVNLWGGDVCDWPEGTAYRGGFEDWPRWIEAFAQQRKITDVCLFGDRRPLHAAALTRLDRLGLGIHVFEEGYFRPDWVTLEKGGVNSRSRLPRDAASYLATADGRAPAPIETVGPWVAEALPDILRHYGRGVLSRSRFPGYRHHRSAPVASEIKGWSRKWLDRQLAGNRARQTEAASLAACGDSPLFLLPLQLEQDAQIVHASPFRSMRDVMDRIMRSFSAAAPAEAKLAVKIHPLDPEPPQRRRQFADCIRRHGLERRAVLLEHSPNPFLLQRVAGLVTVNSTFGLQALERGVPVKVLGACFWDFAGLTTQAASLDAFWQAPAPPSPEVFTAFKEVVMRRTQLNGGFYSARGRRVLLGSCLDRLQDDTDMAAPWRRGPRWGWHDLLPATGAIRQEVRA